MSNGPTYSDLMKLALSIEAGGMWGQRKAGDIVLDTNVVQKCDQCGEDIEGVMAIRCDGDLRQLRVYHDSCAPIEN